MSYLSLTPTGCPEYVLFDGQATTWVPVGTQDWGNAVWEHEFAGSRGTQGSAPAQGRVQNRTVNLTLRCYGVDQEATITLVNQLDAVVDNMRRVGGILTRRVNGQTYRQYMRVLTASPLALSPWDKRQDHLGVRDVVMSLVCAPYAEGAPMAFVDPAERIPDRYVAAAGSLTNLAVVDGLLGIASSSAHLLVDQMRGYLYGDVQVAAWCKPGSTSAGDRRWGVLLRFVDPSNWLAATIEQVSGNGFLRLRSCIAGTQTVLAEGSVTSLATTAGPGTWVMGTVEGERVALTHSYVPTTDAGRRSPPTAWSPSGAVRVSHTLTGAAKGMWGPGTEGKVGLYAVPQDASGTGGWLALHVQPSAHQGGQQASSPGIRHHYPIRTNIPGSAPALAEVAITRDSAATASAPVWGMLAWARRRSGCNRCTNGAFSAGQTSGLSNTVGWNVAAGLSGVASPATSLTPATGGGAATLVMTTTILSGAVYTMQHEFRIGRTYRAVCEVQLAAGSPNVQLCLGASGDIAASAGTAPAASPGWTELTVDWTPTATVHGGANPPAVAIRASGTAGGSVVIRRVRVFDTTETLTIDTQADGRGAIPPLGIFTEGGGGLHYEAGSGGTIATADNSSESPIFHRSWSMTSISGAGSMTVSGLLDPHLLDPDDYTAGGSIDIEVWARVRFSTTVVGPRVAAWVTHPRAPGTSDALGTRRAVAPWGTAGKQITVTSDHWRLVRIGTLTIPVADAEQGYTLEPVRLVVNTTWSAGSSGAARLSGIVLVPARSRAITPTGVQLSAGGYPSLIGVGDSSVVLTKIIRPDLSGAIRDTQSRGIVGSAGMGGSLIELPTGPDVDLLLLTSSQIPDDPSPAAADAAHSTRIEVAVSPTPRWGHLRELTPAV